MHVQLEMYDASERPATSGWRFINLGEHWIPAYYNAEKERWQTRKGWFALTLEPSHWLSSPPPIVTPPPGAEKVTFEDFEGYLKGLKGYNPPGPGQDLEPEYTPR